MIIKFRCEQHGVDLNGHPNLVSQVNDGVTEWIVDTSEMWCPNGNNTPEDHEDDCYESWTVQS
jgi:hypothetical protein